MFAPFVMLLEDEASCQIDAFEPGGVPMKKTGLLLGILLLLLAACGSQAQAPASPTATPTLAQNTATPTSAPLGPLGAAGCKPPSPQQPSGVAGPEFQGTSANASLWMLLFNSLGVKQDIWMVWT